ncbi:hypothetical protein CCZ01_08175 [Helicobacter monodelphidis]|uniref:PaaI family thioesterase n=1 Tax=Helicobacter sp. 15-1451 TaxID=2004995 RepID=UPI000DCD7FEA|nr:hypothetical protein [Helicobacter sp. 15-1451]RAX56825.1 hypothetical protein CCZ01_08175 [Helicobacter sp. 15-1451]
MDEQQGVVNLPEDEELAPLNKDNITIQQVYTEADTSTFGIVKELRPGFCAVSFTPNSKMKVDALGLVHSGYLFSAANYTAMCAVNEPNAVPISAQCYFFAPFELGNTLDLRAEMLQNDTKKREVKVEGFVLDIKVFEAIFEVAIFEHHVFKLQITGQKKFD